MLMECRNGPLPTITLEAGELHVIASDAEDALIAADAPFYVRGESIVRPVVDDVAASHGRRTKVARLSLVTEAAMIDRLSRSAMWERWDGRAKKIVRADPPAKVAATILSRDGEWRFRPLSGVITTPTLRPDGTILATAGYDEETRLLLIDPPSMPSIPDQPTKQQAAKALAFLDELLDEFPFIDAESRTVALSALITPIVRGAVPVAPMHATSAPVAGSGKSYIIDLASAINSGERAPVLTAGRNEEETEKRLISALLSGQTIISIDNVNGQLGGDFLCQVIERPVVAVRPLGQSVFTKIESRATCFATGNNIQLIGDMTRRVISCHLDPQMERPETRAFNGNPFDRVLAKRGSYVAAALIVVRAYVVAGFPDQLRPLASFEDWSRLVRSALVWLGKPDPCITMERARAEDPVTSALTAMAAAWHASTTKPLTTGGLRALAVENDDSGHIIRENLRCALMDVAEGRNGGIDTKRLGKYLGEHKGRIVSGLKIVGEEDSHLKQMVWWVVKA